MPDQNENSTKPKLTKAQRRELQEAQRAAKQNKKEEKSKEPTPKKNNKPKTSQEKPSNETKTQSALVANQEEKEKPKFNKAERRQIQEAQRAAKTAKQRDNAPAPSTEKKEKLPTINERNKKKETSAQPKINEIYLFQHLQSLTKNFNPEEIDQTFFECFKILLDHNSEDTVFCIDFIHATKDFLAKEFASDESLSRNFMSKLIDNLDQIYVTEMLPITVQSFLKYLKLKSSEIQLESSAEAFKINLTDYLEEFEQEMILLAGEAISERASEYIKDGENVAIYGFSTLIKKSLFKAKDRGVLFSVLIVDSSPFFEGRKMLKELTEYEIPCKYCLINAFSSISHEISVLLLGCSGLLTNGNVLAPMGSNLLAGCVFGQKPVIVCSETFKFWDLAQTDIFEFNEILPHELMVTEKTPKDNANLKVLNLKHDVIQPSNVTAVVTEIATLPTSSVPVILRVKQG